jgi:hypothetical protein
MSVALASRGPEHRSGDGAGRGGALDWLGQPGTGSVRPRPVASSSESVADGAVRGETIHRAYPPAGRPVKPARSLAIAAESHRAGPVRAGHAACRAVTAACKVAVSGGPRAP